MTLKTKLITSVSMFFLVVALLVVGVWALKTVNFSVGGNLSYIAPGIEATISNGTLTNGLWVNANDANTKMPETKITRTDTEETLTEKFSYWQDLNINFNDEGDDIQISFTITNDSTTKYIAICIDTSYTSATNCTIGVDATLVVLNPNGLHTFILTIAVTDKSANASMTNFAVVFNMYLKDSQTQAIPEEVSHLTFEYDSTNLVAKLASCDATAPEEVEIPSEIIKDGQNYIVTSIGDSAFKSLSSITSISIPDGVTSIGYASFYGCRGLTSISIPDSVTSVGEYAFTGCNNLSYRTYGNAKYLGSSQNLYAVLLEASSTTITSCIINKNCKVIAYRAFMNCTSLASITFSDSVVTIGDYAYSNCTAIDGIITIPDSVKNIGKYAFFSCSNMPRITIGTGIANIGEYAFAECTSLAYADIMASTPPTGGNGIFENCSALSTIFVPKASVNLYQSSSAGCLSSYIGKIVGTTF